VLIKDYIISGIMARMLASDVVDLWFPVVLIKDYIYTYIIGICCFFANHSVSRSKKQDELTWNQDNASEWGDSLLMDCSLSELAL
jgi:hypothetical protein